LKAGILMNADTCSCEKNRIDTGKIDSIVEAHERTQASLIPVLQEIQAEYGYLPEAAMDVVGRSLNLSVTQIFAVVTFYKQFRLTPQGEHLIKVCHGTACHVAGAEGLSVALRQDLGVGDGETTGDRKFTLESVACLGCCSLAPVIMVSDDTHGRLTPDKAKKVVAKYGGDQAEGPRQEGEG